MEEEGFVCEFFIDPQKEKKMLICKQKDYFPGSPNNGYIITVIYLSEGDLVSDMLNHVKVID